MKLINCIFISILLFIKGRMQMNRMVELQADGSQVTYFQLFPKTFQAEKRPKYVMCSSSQQ